MVDGNRERVIPVRQKFGFVKRRFSLAEWSSCAITRALPFHAAPLR